MDAPAVIYALRWLIHDTFRQTLTSRVFWILIGLSALVASIQRTVLKAETLCAAQLGFCGFVLAVLGG